MDEAEKEIQTTLDGTRREAESLDARRVYAAPEVTVLEFESVIKGGGSAGSDGFVQFHRPG